MNELVIKKRLIFSNHIDPDNEVEISVDNQYGALWSVFIKREEGIEIIEHLKKVFRL